MRPGFGQLLFLGYALALTHEAQKAEADQNDQCHYREDGTHWGTAPSDAATFRGSTGRPFRSSAVICLTTSLPVLI